MPSCYYRVDSWIVFPLSSQLQPANTVSWCHRVRYTVDISMLWRHTAPGPIIQNWAAVAGLGAMNGPWYPDTEEGFLHTLPARARTIPSPAQPIWESNIDTHFLTSAGGRVAVAGLSNESLLRLCCDLWLVPAAGCGDAPSSVSRLHFQVLG